jgi:phage host-nuclease inhibitor protein Gam
MDIEKKRKWSVTDKSSADWAIKKISEAEHQYMDYVEYLDDMKRKFLDRIRKLRESADKKHESDISYLRDSLKSWTEVELDGGKTKHIDLIYGRVGYRKNPDTVEIFDEEQLLEYAEENNPDLIITKKSISKEALKNALNSGENIPFARMRSGDNKWYIDCKEGLPSIEVVKPGF